MCSMDGLKLQTYEGENEGDGDDDVESMAREDMDVFLPKTPIHAGALVILLGDGLYLKAKRNFRVPIL